MKSILLLDYESIDHSLNGADGNGNMRLAERARGWLAAIESGRLVGPKDVRRRLVGLRCYAGPEVRGKQRDVLTAAGFTVVDVAGKGAADLHIAMDTIDALSATTEPDEVIILTSGSDLAPLLKRLKTNNMQTVVFDDGALRADDRALADAVLPRDDLAELLAEEEKPSSEPAAPANAGFRAEIEAFARRVHAATSVPLLSPKAYAELFRHLTDEIRENGYHFQTTAKNVAERMAATGRNVTRRQVVFIVKGLALKGHVFSTNDTPEKLAEVFREQARYLIKNAGIAVEATEERLIQAWFVGGAPPRADSNQTRPESNKASDTVAPRARAPQPEASQPKPRVAQAPPPTPQAAPRKEKVVAQDAPAGRTTAAQPHAPTQPHRQPVAARPAAPVARRAPDAAPPAAPQAAVRPAPASPLKPPPLPLAREEAKAVIAARIAASAKLKVEAAKAAKAAAERPSPAASAQRPRLLSADANADALESSILAAIAEAVDVLVDDNAPREAEDTMPAGDEPELDMELDEQVDDEDEADIAPEPVRRTASSPQKPPAPLADDDNDDIGDQIQRIIASYNRNRDA